MVHIIYFITLLFVSGLVSAQTTDSLYQSIKGKASGSGGFHHVPEKWRNIGTPIVDQSLLNKAASSFPTAPPASRTMSVPGWQDAKTFAVPVSPLSADKVATAIKNPTPGSLPFAPISSLGKASEIVPVTGLDPSMAWDEADLARQLGMDIPSMEGMDGVMPLRKIPGRLADELEFGELDSLNRLGAKIKGHKQKREQVTDGVERFVFTKRPKLMDRSYFEGLLGFDPQRVSISQVSPALGVMLSRRFSVGGGPNLMLGDSRPPFESRMGLRTFLKYELLPQNAYLQAEETGHLRKGPQGLPVEGVSKGLSHYPAIGGGYVIKLAKDLGLNVMALYNPAQRWGGLGQLSPFNIRMGLSTLRPGLK